MMRILICGINFHPEPTGIGKYTAEMADWLAGRGHEVRVITAPPFYPQWRTFPGYSAWKYSRECFRLQTSGGRESTLEHDQETDIEVFRCPTWIPKSPNGAKRLLHLASFALSSVPSMARQVRWSPDIVVLIEPTLFCALQALLVARWAGAKSWLHIQDFEVDAAFGLGYLSSSRIRDWANALERKILSRFDRISAISNRMVGRLSSKGADPSRCVLFPNWVDTEEIHPYVGPSPFRAQLGVKESTVVALYSGSMAKKQGLDLLVQVARRLSRDAGVHFVFCGDGPYRQIFIDKAKDLPNVSLLPVQPAERLNDLLNLADIHLLPQLADAADLVMPSKLTGMMASGRAIVATADPGTQLFAVLEGRGIVIPPKDVDSFASTLLQLSNDPSLRAHLGEEARRYAVSHMSRDKILDKFEGSMFSACGIPSPNVTRGLLAHQIGSLAVEEGAMVAGGDSDD